MVQSKVESIIAGIDSGVTISPCELKRKRNKNGDTTIYLRFTKKGCSRYKSTGIKLHHKYWDKDEKRVKTSHPKSKVYNEIIAISVQNAIDARNKLYIDNELPLTLENLKLFIEDKQNLCNTKYNEVWISVREKLPDKYQHTAVAIRNGYDFTRAVYCGNADWQNYSDSSKIKDVTHWIPLPELAN